MTLGADIKEILQEVGIEVTIFRTPNNITGEYVQPIVNAQDTKPFIREFFTEAKLSHDTQIIAGDTLQSVSDNRIFLVMNMTPTMFEGAAYQYSAVFYKCNTSGILYRPITGEENYHSTLTWDEIKNPCYALLTESLYGNELDEDEEIGPVSKSKIDCYIPHSIGIKEGDRYQVSLDEYYQVEHIMTRRFDNVDLVTLGEDNRGATGE